MFEKVISFPLRNLEREPFLGILGGMNRKTAGENKPKNIEIKKNKKKDWRRE